MKYTKKIVHLTSAHERFDIRIFFKMCKFLGKYGYDVTLVVADGEGYELRDGVKIVDVGKNLGGRTSRMTTIVNKVYLKAKELDADVYHLHDPELMRIGNKLKRLGKSVIFDAHEDLPKQILSKSYLNKFLKGSLSKIFAGYEKYSCSRYDYIITATPSIRDKFSSINPKVVDINNYPIIGEFALKHDWKNKTNAACYVGAISAIRGIREVVKAMEYVNNGKLNLIGKFSEKTIKNEVSKYPGWKNVDSKGYLDRQSVAAMLGQSIVGLVTFLPAPNHMDAQPNKMFEYMSAGLPIITSNFPIWRQVVEGAQCGLCVDPLNPHAIAEAIQYLLDHPAEAEQMGKNGVRAVENKYNWPIEEKKLLKIYKDLLN
jgi:glycosyltransferase involved in cell wall biosynthesis